MERKRLRNILIFLFILLVFLFSCWYVYDYINRKDSDKDDVETVASPLYEEQDTRGGDKQPAIEILDSVQDAEQWDSETEAPEQEDVPVVPAGEVQAFPDEKPSQAAAGKIPRTIEGEHRVRKGESFSLVTGIYWDDIFLWPELYIHNDMRSDDPDLIYPDEIITIYNRLGLGDDFTSGEISEILEAYIEVYKVYKKLGTSKNNSVWSLLWCASRYDHDFLDRYQDQIDPADMEMARKYIAEQGYLD